ncbi:MAG: TetR/AcrR family transcriptional regulator [Acidobacteria bacterium]|nr:TetR/AcrR family transcriptional regulator [Acidobacteriota bacterium]
MTMPVARPSKEEVVAAFRRKALLEAASRVFGAKGFEDATMEAIAERAGVAKGTVYLYYPSKQSIYDATFAAGTLELTRLTDEAVRAAPSVKAAIAAFVETRVTYFQQHSDYFRLYVTEISRMVSDRGPRKGVCRNALESHTRVLQQVIAGAVQAGEARAVDPAATAMAIFDITRGLVARRFTTSARSDAARDIEFLTDLIWAGLRPGPEGHTA